MRDFYKHMDEGNPSKAAELISPQTRAQWGGKIDAKLAAMSRALAECKGIENLEINQDKEQSSDNLRVFKVQMTMKSDEKDCKFGEDTMKVMKIDGKWHIQLG